MTDSLQGRRGAVVASHHLASQAGLSILREGGNAIEAMVAAAATMTVVYPHMNGLGADGFWLISPPEGDPIAIQGIGRAARSATIDMYRSRGYDVIPSRGPEAAITVAGTVSGWAAALEVAKARGGNIPLARMLADPAYYARHGFPLSPSQHQNTRDRVEEVGDVPGFAGLFLADGAAPPIGHIFRNTALADAFDRLAEAGLDDFYRGDLARSMAGDLERLGSPLTLADFEAHEAYRGEPLSLQVREATIYNLAPPTQGLAALLILGLYERLPSQEAESANFIHSIVEATKRAFIARDRIVTDPTHVGDELHQVLGQDWLDSEAAKIDARKALPWPQPASPGDTVWLGAIDQTGLAVSYIQSLYWEFGSATVLPETGITWQNRGVSFALDSSARNPLEPGRLPFHTNNPALARFEDGRAMVYGTMGGDGQPQTQAMLFARYARFGQSAQAAVSAPRWLLGRTWGQEITDLRIESRIDESIVQELRDRGHQISVTGPFDPVMGHAGMLVVYPDGRIEGGADPRGDGVVATY